jgi:sugar/nucleoside kinase (ribokinase family)
VIGVVGLVARDTVDGGTPRLGGGGWYCARALATLGQDAVVATKYAPADHRLVAQLFGLGLEVVWRPARETVAFAHTYRGQHRESVLDAVGEPFTTADAETWIADALGDARWVLTPALSRSDFPPETLAALAPGRRLVLDGQGLVRPGRPGPVVRDADYRPEVLEHIQALKLNESEAALLDLDALDVPEIVVTLGPGGVVIRAEGAEEHVAARPLAAIDPTGAGDAFTAAYVVARAAGQGPVEAARSATAVVHGLLTKWQTR